MVRIFGIGLAVGFGVWSVLKVWDLIRDYRIDNGHGGLANDGDDWAPFPCAPLAKIVKVAWRPDIEQQVCRDILDRQGLGVAKYGTTVAENPLELREWLQHSYEELLDASIYTKRAMAELDEKMKPYFEVVEASTQVVQKASIGDQNFIPCLQGNDQPTKVLRHMLVKLADALREV
jgi:hypothetical protein